MGGVLTHTHVQMEAFPCCSISSFEAESLAKPEACHLNYSGWPPKCKDQPLSVPSPCTVVTDACIHPCAHWTFFHARCVMVFFKNVTTINHHGVCCLSKKLLSPRWPFTLWSFFKCFSPLLILKSQYRLPWRPHTDISKCRSSNDHLYTPRTQAKTLVLTISWGLVLSYSL